MTKARDSGGVDGGGWGNGKGMWGGMEGEGEKSKKCSEEGAEGCVAREDRIREIKGKVGTGGRQRRVTEGRKYCKVLECVHLHSYLFLLISEVFRCMLVRALEMTIFSIILTHHLFC